MDHDDRTVGQILSRREVLKLLGTLGATVFVGGQAIRWAQSAEGLAQTTGSAAYLPLLMRDSGSPTATPTAMPTNVATSTATATNVATSTATATNVPASTATNVPASTATNVPTSTATATNVPTSTATATNVPGSTATATPIPSCVVRPEQTGGPYFVDEMLNRSDIRSDPATGVVEQGALLELAFNVSRLNQSGCTPFEGVQVDIWQCNALGGYSDVESNVGKKYLRGYQLTDGNGLAQFITIYPGYYPGRTVHIHFKLRATLSDQNYEFTSQVYFDDTLTDQVHTLEPYASNGARDTPNEQDGIYQNGGSQLLLTLTPTKQGYTTTFDIALQI